MNTDPSPCPHTCGDDHQPGHRQPANRAERRGNTVRLRRQRGAWTGHSHGGQQPKRKGKR